MDNLLSLFFNLSKVMAATKIDNLFPSESLLEQAFETACYLHHDRQIALQLLIHAVDAMKRRAGLEGERQRKRDKADKTRQVPNKVLLSDAQRYQLGVWEVSTYYELLDEARQFPDAARDKLYQPKSSMIEKMVALQLLAPSGSVATSNLKTIETMLLIRYIKHLALLAVDQNALYVAVGVNQLLYNYSPKETEEIYRLADKNYDRGTDIKVYGEARETLCCGLMNRFQGLLEVSEESEKQSFATKSAMPGFKHLAETTLNCLEMLTLWETSCKPIESESDRIHHLFDPACHDKLTSELKLTPSTERLRIPIFKVLQNVNKTSSSNHRRNKPKLTAKEFSLLLDILKSLKESRKKSAAKWLLIITDGLEQSEINLPYESSVKFGLPVGSRLIEVYSRETDGDLLLATCWLSEFAESGEPVMAETRAEGGQVIRFNIAVAKDGSATVEIAYRETKPLRWLAMEWRRLVHRFEKLSFVPKPAIAWAMAAVTALALLFALWMWRQKPNELPKVVKQASPKVEPSPIVAPSPPNEPPLIAENRPKSPAGKDEPDSIRREASVQLAAVERVVVQSFGEDEFSRNLCGALIFRLRQSPLVVEETISATTDAVLQRKPGANNKRLTLRLVNREGDELWQASFRQDDARLTAERAVQKLIGDIEVEKRKAWR